MYAIVENNSVVKFIRELPTSYTFPNGTKTGGFDKLGLDAQISNGYYPVEDVKPSFDMRIEVLKLDSTEVRADKVVRTYVKEDKDIETVKTNKIGDINRHADSLSSNSLFLHNDRVFRLSENSVNNAVRLQGMSQILPYPANFTWTDAYGDEYPLPTEADFKALATTLAVQSMNIIGVAKYHIDNVKQLTVLLDVADYDFSQGWNNYIEPVDEQEIV